MADMWPNMLIFQYLSYAEPAKFAELKDMFSA